MGVHECTVQQVQPNYNSPYLVQKRCYVVRWGRHNGKSYPVEKWQLLKLRFKGRMFADQFLPPRVRGLWSVRLPCSIYPLVYCCFGIKSICSQGSSRLVHFDPMFWVSCDGNSLQDTGYPGAIVLYGSRDLLTCPIFFFFFNFLNFSPEAASISGESTSMRLTGTKLFKRKHSFVTPNISYPKQFNKDS